MDDLVERLRRIPYILRWPSQHREIIEIAKAAAERLEGASAAPARTPAVPIDWQLRRLWRDGRWHRIPAMEWRVFEALVKARGKVVSRETLHRDLYWRDPCGGANIKTIDIYLSKLRKHCPWPIRTVFRTGVFLEGYDGPEPPAAEREVSLIDAAICRFVAPAPRSRLMAGR
ncbi:MAG TPA: winged helix-turn-helix domain-containing protein [Stellaceae bacterium]|nr:winged helix-turn-helix domain-containing protein [Stellaceae bacterium]